MHTTLVMTVIGPDRPGLVDLLATAIAEHDGNWLESRLARLGGQFAGIVRARVPGDRQAALTQELARLADQQLRVSLTPDAPAAEPSAPSAVTTLELLGQDRPGIVRQISGALARHGVNVEELETGCESAPMTGETLFRARARLAPPPGCNLVALQQELERIAADLMVEVTLNLPPAAVP